MNDRTWTGVLGAGDDRFVPDTKAQPGAAQRGLRGVWGVVCGAAFLAARTSVYLLVLPLTAIVCLAGVALYGAQALLGNARG
jgi:hypothetical protein